MVHVACAHDAPLDIVRKILNALCPYIVLYQDDTSRNTPLHLTLRYNENEDLFHFLFNLANSTAILPNGYGNLPLHTAIIYERSVHTIRSLLLSYPESVYVYNKHGSSPLQLFFKTWHNELTEMKKRHSNCFYNIQSFHKDYSCLIYIKKILMLLTKMINDGNLDEEGFENIDKFPLHSIVQTKSLPPIYFQLILDIFPEEIMVQNFEGNLPLHVAVMQNHCSFNVIDAIYLKKSDALRRKNTLGKNPFMVCLDSGMEWDNEVLQALYRGFPECISQIDDASGLAPFFIACSSENISLNVTYQLLLRDPSVVNIN